MTLTVGQLKDILKDIPDDYELWHRDINFGTPAESVWDGYGFDVDKQRKILTLPNIQQDHLE